MKLKFEVKKDQKFHITNAKNLPFCYSCKNLYDDHGYTSCDEFLNCPYSNYIPEKTRYIYTTNEFLDVYKDSLKKSKFLTKELIDEYLDNCVEFPSGIYYDSQLISVNSEAYINVDIVKLLKTKEVIIGQLMIQSTKIDASFNNCTKAQEEFINNLKNELGKIINIFILE